MKNNKSVNCEESTESLAREQLALIIDKQSAIIKILESSIDIIKTSEIKKTINAFVATGLGDVDIIPFSKVVRIKDYPLEVEVYFGLGECSYITFSDSERIQINAYKKWLVN